MIFKSISRALSILISISMLSGCATTIGNKSQLITIETEPAGALIYLNNRKIGPSSITLNLRLKDTLLSRKEKRELFIEHHKNIRQVSVDQEIKTREEEELLLAEHMNKNKHGYMIKVSKKGYEDGFFVVSPTKKIKDSPNRKACIFDATLSVFTLGVPMMVNAANNSCHGFENIYHFTLKPIDGKNPTTDNDIETLKYTSLDLSQIKAQKIDDSENPLINPNVTTARSSISTENALQREIMTGGA